MTLWCPKHKIRTLIEVCNAKCHWSSKIIHLDEGKFDCPYKSKVDKLMEKRGKRERQPV
jgi:hypothetical protein